MNTQNIASNLLKPYRVKHFFQVSALVLLAYKIGEIIPGLITISLGTWMNRAFALAPYIALVFIISMWNPTGDRLHYKFRLPSMTNRSFSMKYLLLISAVALVVGLIMFWLVGNYPSWQIVGIFIFMGSVITMLVLGFLRPGQGPIVFFAAYPFLWFAEGRLYASLSSLLAKVNIPVWLQNFVTDWRNIHIVMAIFAIGFLFYIIKNFNKLERTVLDIPIVLFLIWTFISVITANDASSRAFNYYFWSWFFPVVFFYATLIGIKNENGIRNIKITLIVLMFFMCFLDLQNASRIGMSIYSEKAIQFTGEERAFSWTIIAYQAGPWIILILPLSLSLLFDRKEKVLIRIFSLFTIALSFAMFIWEMQRTVILTLVLMAIMYLIIYRQTWKKQLLVYTTIILFGVTFMREKFVELLTLTRPEFLLDNPFTLASNLDRLYLYEHGWDVVKNNPVFGIGPGGFKLLGIGLLAPEVSSHNIYLETALESGIIAAVLLIAILFYPVVKALQSIRYEKFKAQSIDSRPWTISLIIFLIYLLLHNVWIGGQGVVVLCIIAVIIRSTKKLSTNTV